MPPSGFVQQTVVPGATVRSVGEKVKPEIVTTVSPTGQAVAAGRVNARAEAGMTASIASNASEGPFLIGGERESR